MPNLEAPAGGNGGEPKCLLILQGLPGGQERPGRVLLRDFYRPALDQAFAESTALHP